MAGKCPVCGKAVTVLHGSKTNVTVGGVTYPGVTYNCPSVGCNAVLGCDVDPIAIKADIVADILAALKKAGVI